MSTVDKKAALANDRFSQPELPTLDELRNAIPKECFEKNLPLALAYVVWDFILLAFMYKIEPIFELAGYPGMILWYFLVGMVLLCIFVIGHDCGHTTFSNYPWVNDIVGHICHGMMGTPYWPWQKSHRHHHMNTSHVTKDKGHEWITEEIYMSYSEFHKFWAYKLGFFLMMIGWWFYTIGGHTDGSHFWPWSRLFTNNKERVQCAISVTVCVAFATAAYYYFGTPFLFCKFYVLPLIAHSFWLLMITYLQHQTDDIQVYEDGSWGYLRGVLQTIDRPYGFGFDYLMHHITDGHVVHHLFFTGIPHYHLMEATAVIKAKLEPFGVYRYQNSPDFLWQLASLTQRLEYLVGEGTGLMMYAKKD